MKILVTGGSGFLGKAMVRRLATVGDVVSQGFHNATGPQLVCDLRDEDALRSLMQEVRPDLVVNCAAYREPDPCEADPQETRRLNVRPVALMLEELHSSARFVQISTDYVFPGTEPPYSELSVRRAVNVYGQSKVEAEESVEASGRGYLLLRIPILVGSDEDAGSKGFISQMVDAVVSGEEQSADHVSLRFPTWTEDVAANLLWLLGAEKTGIWHISSGLGGTRYDWTCRLAEVMGRSHSHIRPGGQPPERPAPRPPNSQLSSDKLLKAGAPGCVSLLDVARTLGVV